MKIYCNYNEDSGDAVFNSNEMGIVNINPNNISLDDYFDEDDLHAIILARLLSWHTKFEELMPVVKN